MRESPPPRPPFMVTSRCADNDPASTNNQLYEPRYPLQGLTETICPAPHDRGERRAEKAVQRQPTGEPR